MQIVKTTIEVHSPVYKGLSLYEVRQFVKETAALPSDRHVLAGRGYIVCDPERKA